MKHTRKALLSLALAAGVGGCADLSGPGIDEDPNSILNLSRPGPLYIGIQAGQTVQFEGQVARIAAQYVQQVAGVGRQSIGFDRYGMDPVTIDPHWIGVYGSNRTLSGGGGLLDIRKMQQLARALGDSTYIGIGKVYEALVMGMAADVWGDVPYREAADSTNETPAFDSQLQVFGDILAHLDSAITIYLPAAGASNLGPPQDNAELIYGGGRSVEDLRLIYTEVAHTLKARYYMHLAELDPANYALALAEVPLGISSPANDFNWYNDLSANGNNIWWQFYATRQGDIAPGAAVIEILKRRIAAGIEDDARLNFFFVPPVDAVAGAPADFFGYRPGGATGLNVVPGIDPGNGSATGTFADFNFANPFIDAGDFRQPAVSYAENQLIGAEAAFQVGGQAAAQPFLDAARANRAYGARGLTPVTFTPTAPIPATLENIMEEKYLAMFLNIEAWSDYKRTCLPALAPAPALNSPEPSATPIPGRIPYGITEINANPNTPNVPPTGQNRNDPNPCPALNYTTTTPLAN